MDFKTSFTAVASTFFGSLSSTARSAKALLASAAAVEEEEKEEGSVLPCCSSEILSSSFFSNAAEALSSPQIPSSLFPAACPCAAARSIHILA